MYLSEDGRHFAGILVELRKSADGRDSSRKRIRKDEMVVLEMVYPFIFHTDSSSVM